MELHGMKTTKKQPQSDHNTRPNGTISPNQIHPLTDRNGIEDPHYLPTDPFLSGMGTENGKNAKSFKVVHKGRGHDPNISPADCPACGQEIAGHLNQIFSTTVDDGQLRHGDVMVVTPKNRRLGNASGVIRGLRQASVPVRVQRKKSRWPCSSNQEETDNQVLVVDTARDGSDGHPAERRPVVVCVQSKKTASSAKDLDALVGAYAASAAIVIVVALAASHARYADEACCEDCCDCGVNDCCGGRTHYSHYDGWQYAGGDDCCNCDCDCAACSGCGDCGGCGGCGGCGDCGGCECGDCDCGGCDCSGCDGCVIS